MGYQFNGKCYLDAADAVAGWKGSFPTPPDSLGQMWFLNAATYTSNASAVTIAGTLKKSTGTATTTITGFQLQSCQVDAQGWLFDKYPVQDILFAVALTVAAILGIISGRMR